MVYEEGQPHANVAAHKEIIKNLIKRKHFFGLAAGKNNKNIKLCSIR